MVFGRSISEPEQFGIIARVGYRETVRIYYVDWLIIVKRPVVGISGPSKDARRIRSTWLDLRVLPV